jgi:hypothetical protein
MSYQPPWGSVFDARSSWRMLVGNFNEDRKVDLMFMGPDGTWWRALSDGAQLLFAGLGQTPELANAMAAGSQARFFAADFTGFGVMDVMFSWIDGVFRIAHEGGNNLFVLDWMSIPDWGN